MAATTPLQLLPFTGYERFLHTSITLLRKSNEQGVSPFFTHKSVSSSYYRGSIRMGKTQKKLDKVAKNADNLPFGAVSPRLSETETYNSRSASVRQWFEKCLAQFFSEMDKRSQDKCTLSMREWTLGRRTCTLTHIPSVVNEVEKVVLLQYIDVDIQNNLKLHPWVVLINQRIIVLFSAIIAFTKIRKHRMPPGDWQLYEGNARPSIFILNSSYIQMELAIWRIR